MSMDVGGASGHVNFAALMRAGAEQTHGTENTTIRHSHVGSKGDLTVELHYGDFGTGHGRQAALYLFRKAAPTAGVFVPLSDLWKYTERAALHIMVPPLARQIYGFVTQMDQMRVLDAVMDYLDDLRKSPPDPNLWKDKSLDAFRESCAEEGLDFFVDVNGKRVLS